MNDKKYITVSESKKDYTPSSKLAYQSETYEKYNMLFDINGLDESIRLNKPEYEQLRDLYQKCFCYFDMYKN